MTLTNFPNCCKDVTGKNERIQDATNKGVKEEEGRKESQVPKPVCEIQGE